MNDLRTAAQQALAFTMRDFASLRDFEAAKAVLHDNLRTALAQQAELSEGLGPLPPTTYVLARESDGYSPERLLSEAGYTEEHMRAYAAAAVALERDSRQALPVAGKVVAWGVFANIDGEWQLQHPMFAGDEQGKVNAEFERASYSGPQPLEVRPLGVVTATAQQAEPVQEPVAEVFVRRDGVSFAFWLKAPPPERTKLYTAPPQRKLVPLTEAEIEHIGITHQSLRQVARAVERAVWEKNHG